MNFSKKNHTIDAFGGDFLARGGIPGCALRNGPLFSGSLRNSVSAMPFPFLAFVAFGTRNRLLRYGVQFIKRRAAPENYTTKAAIALAAFVDLKAKYKYLILLQGS